jgi:hypothetical protein
VIVGLITSGLEPMFASSLMGEGQTPWDLASWVTLMRELLVKAPDLFVVPALALPLWMTDRPRRYAPVVLWITVLGAGLITAAKLGSGLNYFLGLRIIEALAIGRLWSYASLQDRPLGRRAALVLVAATALVPGLLPIAESARKARGEALFAHSPEGRRFLLGQQELFKLAEDPRVNLLTDSGVLQLHQRERAAFLDPFQFRMLVESGIIRPDVILEQVRDEKYNLVITTSDLNSPRYEANIFGLPIVLTRAARAHYRPSGRRLGLYLYVNRVL